MIREVVIEWFKSNKDYFAHSSYSDGYNWDNGDLWFWIGKVGVLVRRYIEGADGSSILIDRHIIYYGDPGLFVKIKELLK